MTNNNTHIDDQRLLELLEKWQKGDYTLADEQALQALAASDAFRQEVVEGYWSSPEADHSLALERLQEKIKGKVQAPTIVSWRPRFMAMAAAFTLLLGAFWVFKSFQRTESDGDIVGTEVQKAPAISIEADSQGDIADAAPRLDKFIRQMPEDRGRVQARESAAEADLPVATNATAPASDRLEGESSKDANSAITYNPSSESEIVSVEEKMDDAQSRSESAKPTPISPAKTSNAGAPPGNDFEVDRKQGNMIESKDKAKKRSSKDPLPDEWKFFKEYLRTNARLPDQAKNNNVSGSVRVRFSLDPFNKINNIEIVRSLGFGCDEEALRLIRAYAWRTGLNTLNPLEVDVPFVR